MIALLSLTTALAALPADQRLVYDIKIAGKTVGSRTLTIQYEDEASGPATRVLEAYTDIDGRIAGVGLSWRQRVTAYSAGTPASFHAVIDEAGRPHEVQAAWTPAGWRLTTVDRARARTTDVPGYSVDLSTVDLMDPGSRYPISRYDSLKVLSSETGDIWEGTVDPLGEDTLTVAGTQVAVRGYAWNSPEGKSKFWYDDEGFLVRYEMRVLGVAVEGVLRTAPPPGPDAFPVALGSTRVDVEDL
jgi:hypothetical protein